MSDLAIRVEHLGKRYLISGYRVAYKTLRESLAAAAGKPFRWLRGERGQVDDTFWALDDISFEVRHGEAVGIIGRNGAGKSTLLKILSRITKPTRGRAELYGRVGSLLEVGTGFHPELTGRENIYLNGAILGMGRREIRRKFDEIVDFAEVEKFLDTPVKFYSSGMYVRLAFAVAAQLEPEILLVDEVLAVGDMTFQKKSLGKMNQVAGSGRTVFFVSHNMASISALCRKCIYLEGGRMKAIGPTDEIVQRYILDTSSDSQTPLTQRTDRLGNGRVRLTDIRFLEARSYQPLDTILSGQPIYVETSYRSQDEDQPLRDFNLGLAFYNNTGQFVAVLNSRMASRAFGQLPPKGKVYCHVPKFPLMVGAFSVKATLQVNSILADQIDNAAVVHVEPGDYFGTGFPNAYRNQGVYVEQRWMEALPEVDAAADGVS